jgi:O-antigen/teichoic acid export membrane protein
MSIVQRSITSVSWNVAASLAQVAVGFLRSVMLSRLLPVEVFGIYGWAGSVIALSVVVADFGMGGGFLYRAPETEDEEQAAAVYFTLKLVFALVWAFLLMVGFMIFTRDQTRVALLVLTATSVGSQLLQTPRLILARRVVHRRLALIQLISLFLTSAVAVGLAWRGVTLWALLSTDLIAVGVGIVALYVWRPVWRPRLFWSPQVVRYFLRFGSRKFLADVLMRALDRVDDLWTGAYLGETSMGLYSRAYAFAIYPRRFLAAPLNAVVGGTYAELKGDRLRLSRVFFRTNAFLVRTGFLLAGMLALVAPEFIRLGLGAKWLPMLDTFRLMLVFTLLDPIKVVVGDLFVAVGRPGKVVQARFMQLVVLVVGLFLMGSWLGITGVALAVDLMLVVGMAILLWQARSFVDFSPRRLFVAPGLALVVGMGLAHGATTLSWVAGSDWRTGFVKIVVFSVVYGVVMLILERRQLYDVVRILGDQLPCRLS